MRIRHNSSKSAKLQAFRNVIRHGLYCHGQFSIDFLCVLCLELRSPKTTQMPAPSPGGAPGGSPGLVVVLMFTVSFFGTLSTCSFGVFGGHSGPQYYQKRNQNDVILKSESCLAHLLEIALPPKREHHFHCFERSSNHLFLSTFLKAYFGASI